MSDGYSDHIIWTTRPLGVISWDSKVKAYVLRIPRQADLPLSFNVWTTTGLEGDGR